MGARKQPPAEQFIARQPGDVADRFIDAQKAAVGVDLDDADGGMLVGRVPALLLLSQILLALLKRLMNPLALGNILEACDEADHLAARVDQRIDVDQNRDARAVRPVDHDLFVANGLSGPQHLADPRLRQPLAFRAVEPGLGGEMLVGLAGLGRAAPDFDGAAVVLDDPPFEVADADRDWQQLENVVGRMQHLLKTGCMPVSAAVRALPRASRRPRGQNPGRLSATVALQPESSPSGLG